MGFMTLYDSELDILMDLRNWHTNYLIRYEKYCFIFFIAALFDSAFDNLYVGKMIS